MKLIASRNGVPVNPGDPIDDHRGEEWEFVMATRASMPGRSGKIVAKRGAEVGAWQQEFYSTVFDLYVEEAK